MNLSSQLLRRNPILFSASDICLGDWICAECNTAGTGWFTSAPVLHFTPLSTLGSPASGIPNSPSHVSEGYSRSYQPLVDENGNILPRKRGRPKKEGLLRTQLFAREDSTYKPAVGASPLRTPPAPLVGPNGEVIKRGRGRPRKYPRPDEG